MPGSPAARTATSRCLGGSIPFIKASIDGNLHPDLSSRAGATSLRRKSVTTVKADIPGVKKEDISVRVEGNLVQIEAQTRSEKETKGDGDKVLRSERHFGAISRSFSLAQDVDSSKVEAKYADGVLTLQLPKAVAADSRRISIQ